MEDVVVHRALPGQNPGPGERGGGWDTNKVSGRNDNTPHVVVFFLCQLKTLKEQFTQELNFGHYIQHYANGKLREVS